MKKQNSNYSMELKHPFNVSFTCERCGELNSFTQEIIGTGNISVYGSASQPNSDATLSVTDMSELKLDAEKQLAAGIKRAEAKLAKGKYSWIKAKKCVKCKRYQSWQTALICKNFFKSFFGGPIVLGLLAYLPLTKIFGSDSSKYPDWVMYVYSSIIIIIWISSIVILLKSLMFRDRKHHNLPNVTL
jgi:hypothetical protein